MRGLLISGATLTVGLVSAASASAAVTYENADKLVKIAKVVGSPILASVAPVPEPATWALILVGIGALGAMLRFRRRSAPAVA